MTAISLGPFVFAGERLAAVAAIVFFLGITAILAGRVDERLGRWSLIVVPIGLVAARLGHVLWNWESFAEDPIRVLHVWEGGFSWIAGAAAVAIYTLIACRGPRLRAWSLGTLAASFVFWNTAWQLTATTDAIAAPGAIFPSTEGTNISLSDFAGRPVVLNLWATWCPPCRREMPMMAAMAKERSDAVFVFANQGEGEDTISAYLSGAGLEIDHLILDQAYALARHYGVAGYPATLFLRSDGTLQTMHFGEISQEALVAALSSLTNSDG